MANQCGIHTEFMRESNIPYVVIFMNEMATVLNHVLTHKQNEQHEKAKQTKFRLLF